MGRRLTKHVLGDIFETFPTFFDGSYHYSTYNVNKKEAIKLLVDAGLHNVQRP